MSKSELNQTKKKNNKQGLIIAFMAILLIINGVQFYLSRVEKEEHEQAIGAKDEEIKMTLSKMDSIGTELKAKIDEIAELGGNIDSLEVVYAELEEEKAKIEQDKNYYRSKYSKIKKEIAGYTALLNEKDAEIEQLKAQNGELFSQNQELKVEQNKLNDSLALVAKNAQYLQSKVDIASRLKAENLNVINITSKGKEKASPFKAKQMGTLKISFSIADNKVAPLESKDIKLRIIEPDNNVLFNVENGSGTFMVEGREEFYTSNQEVIFDNSNQVLTFTYDKGSSYIPGNYIAEIYGKDYMMGNIGFIVK